MMSPLISIIIPTWQRDSFIGTTLDSILAQSYRNWECLVIDDGSDDYTSELLEFYVKKDSRFRFYKRPSFKPKGANSCRNYGFDLCSGDYVNWFDSDDVMFPHKLKEQMDILLKDLDSDFCTCQYGLYDENFKFISRMPTLSTDLLINFLTQKSFLNLSTCIFRAKSIEDIQLDESLSKAQDFDFLMRFLNSRGHGTILKKELVKVRLHNYTITHSFKLGDERAIRSEMDVRLKSLAILKGKGKKDDYRIGLNLYTKFLMEILLQQKKKLYFEYFHKLFFHIPKGYKFHFSKMFFISLIYITTKRGLYFFRNCFYLSRGE